MWWCSISTPYRPPQAGEAHASGVSSRSPVNTSVPAALARRREADQPAHGHLVGQGAQLDGGPGDQCQGAGRLQDVGVDVGVPAGAIAHLRVVGRITQRPPEIEVEAVGDEVVGAVVTDTDRGDI